MGAILAVTPCPIPSTSFSVGVVVDSTAAFSITRPVKNVTA